MRSIPSITTCPAFMASSALQETERVLCSHFGDSRALLVASAQLQASRSEPDKLRKASASAEVCKQLCCCLGGLLFRVLPIAHVNQIHLRGAGLQACASMRQHMLCILRLGMAPGQTAPCGLSAPELCSAAARARFLCRTEKASLEPSSKAVNARHHALRNLDAGAHAACLGTPWQSTNGCLSELPAGSWEGPPTSLRSPSCKPPPIAHFSCPAHCSSAWPGRSKLPCGGGFATNG